MIRFFNNSYRRITPTLMVGVFFGVWKKIKYVGRG